MLSGKSFAYAYISVQSSEVRGQSYFFSSEFSASRVWLRNQSSETFFSLEVRGQSLSQGQGSIFCCFHLLALSGAFVVKATKMQDAVDNDAMQFFIIVLMKEFCIASDRIQ